MPRKSNSRAAQGAGTIRKKTVTRNGQTYNYWETRITTGYDPGTGKQIQRSITGKTQKDVREKMQAAAVELNTGTYKEPLKMTMGEWLDIWAKDYLNNVKPRTREIYEASIRNHLKPALGTIRLEALDTPTIQAFYNGLSSPCKTRDHALSPTGMTAAASPVFPAAAAMSSSCSPVRPGQRSITASSVLMCRRKVRPLTPLRRSIPGMI